MADAPSPAPYDDWADLYDKVYAYLDYDLDFWLGQANAAGGPVLEMGCGTGRVALALHGVPSLVDHRKVEAQQQAGPRRQRQ